MIGLVLVSIGFVFLIIAAIAGFIVMSDIYSGQNKDVMTGGAVIFVFVIAIYTAAFILSVRIL